MAGLFDLYAAALLRHSKMQPRLYSSEELTRYTLLLPPGEFWQEQNGWEITELPIIGESMTLTQYMQVAYFAQLRADAPVSCLPFLIPPYMLGDLGNWDDWKTLVAYLAKEDLIPYILFRNKKIRQRNQDLYLADIRIGFTKDYVYGG